MQAYTIPNTKKKTYRGYMRDGDEGDWHYVSDAIARILLIQVNEKKTDEYTKGMVQEFTDKLERKEEIKHWYLIPYFGGRTHAYNAHACVRIVLIIPRVTKDYAHAFCARILRTHVVRCVRILRIIVKTSMRVRIVSYSHSVLVRFRHI